MPSRSASRSTSRSKKTSSSAHKPANVKKTSRRKSKSASKQNSSKRSSGSKKGSRKGLSGSKHVSQAGGKGVKMTAGLGDIFGNLSGVPSILFAGWDQCGHCRDFMPIWQDFSRNPVITNTDIVLSAITAYGNNPVIPGMLDVTSFPSIYYTLPDGTTMQYSGNRTVDAMINFAHDLGMAKLRDDVADAIAENVVNGRKLY